MIDIDTLARTMVDAFGLDEAVARARASRQPFLVATIERQAIEMKEKGLVQREPSGEFLARWNEHVARAQRLADEQVARQIVAGNRKEPRRLPTVRNALDKRPDTATLLKTPEGRLDWQRYDHIIVAFSGGKDSLACVLHLLDQGVPRERIELWHYAVDGEPGKAPRFFDWPITEDYCRAVAEALGIRLLFHWRNGGFEQELLKTNARTNPATITLPDGSRISAGGLLGDVTTQGKFPRQGTIAGGRWCSGLLKIDVGRMVFTNPRPPAYNRFENKRSILLMGERAEESGPRSRYPDVEIGSDTQTRSVTEWHPLLAWREPRVWDIIRAYGIRPHPAYYAGFGRLSCMPCIFGDDDQWATVGTLDPDLLKKIAKYERDFFKKPSFEPGHLSKKTGDWVDDKWVAHPGTILNVSDKKGNPTGGVEVRAKRGISYLEERVPDDELAYAKANAQLAMSEHYPRELTLVTDETWQIPRGAGRKSGGPT